MTGDDPAQTPENPEEHKVVAMLLESFRKLDELSEILPRFQVLSGTSLAGDNAATPYETLSSQVETCVQWALDNTQTLQALLVDAKMVPVVAHYGLLRNALEMVGTGFWLLGPVSRDERVLRSLQLAFEARKDYVNAANAIQRSEAKFPTDDPVRLELEAQRDRRFSIRGRSLAPQSTSSRLRLSEKYCSEQPFSLLALWRLASGAMHGRREVLKNLLEHEIVESNEDIVRTKSRSGIVPVANILQHVEVYTLELSMLLFERGQLR